MRKDEVSLGKILALDLGEKRIGVALSDASRSIARAYTVVVRQSRQEDYERLGRIAHEEGATLLIVGLPVSLDASGEPLTGVTPRVAWMRDYALHLSETLGLPLIFRDESFSTVEAAASLRMRGKRRSREQERLDAVAAAMVLQAYLDTPEKTGSR